MANGTASFLCSPALLLSSVVIRDLYIARITCLPPEHNAVLFVDPNAAFAA